MQISSSIQCIISDAVGLMENLMSDKSVGASATLFMSVPCNMAELKSMYKAYMTGEARAAVDEDEALEFSATEDVLEAISLFQVAYEDAHATPSVNNVFPNAPNKNSTVTTAATSVDNGHNSIRNNTSDGDATSDVDAEWQEFLDVLSLPSPTLGELMHKASQCLRDLRVKESGTKY